MLINLHDTFNLIRKITPLRLLNVCKLWASYYLSRLLKRPLMWGLPVAASIEPTTSCNLRCPECPSGLRQFTRPTGMLSAELHHKMLEQMSDHLLYLLLYFQGEPYLHPDFFELVKKASDKKIYTATSTNGHYLSAENAEKTVRSGLDRLIISIDGSTQESYARYRVGGSLQKVLEGTENMMQAKKKLGSRTPHVIWQFILFEHNLQERAEIVTMAQKYRPDKLVFKTAQVYHLDKGSDLVPGNTEAGRYIRLPNGSLQIKNKLYDKCLKMWQSCVITVDGAVVPCCFDKDAKYTMGNIRETSFSHIWHSAPYRTFRKQLLNGRKEIDICQNCTEGSEVFA